MRHLFQINARVMVCFLLLIAVMVPSGTLLANNIVCGDVNGDGTINVDDAIFVLRHSTGLIQLNNDQRQRADVNEDGKIDVNDAIIILRYLVGIVNSLPYDGSSQNPTDTQPQPNPTPSSHVPDHRVKSDGNLYGLDYWKNEVRISKAPSSLVVGDYQVKDDFTFYLISGNNLINKGKYYYLNDVPYAIMNLDIQADPKVTAAFLQNRVTTLRRGNPSPFTELGPAFIEAQETWGINALYLMAHGALESAWGTSKIAQDKNNLFGYKAYDSDPYNYAGTFRSMEECILYVAGYIRRAYLSEDGRWFNGPNLEGMNNFYATDPMWKIKIARVMGSILDHNEYKAVKKVLQKGKVVNVNSGSHLNVRSGPGSSFGVVTTLSGGTEVSIKGMRVVNSCNWYKVVTASGEGWACGSFIEVTTVPEGAVYINDWYLIDKDPPVVNVRSGPGTSHGVVDTLNFAQQVKIEEIKMSGKDAWYRITYTGSKNDRWVNGSFVTIKW